MFKRIVSIVMALLVILGTAGYGGSVFAEEAPQEQADSASVTFSENYIYLDPTGMTKNGADWTKSGNEPEKVNLGYIPSGDKTTTFVTGYYNGNLQCWEWKLSDLKNIANGTKIFFTYTTNWNDIDNNPYYRTEDFTLTGDKSTIGGNIYSQNGDSNKSYKAKAYALKTLQSNAGSKLTFVDMTGTMSGVKAQFSYDESFSNNEEVKLADNGIVTVPADNGKNMYRYMKFVDASDAQLTDPIKIEDALDKGGILYYGIRTDSDGITKSVWSKDKKNSSEPTIKKLYFDRTKFPTNPKDSIQVKIGNGEYENVNEDPEDSTILSYDLNGKTLSSDTIIEVRKDKITYRFYPNGNLSLVTIYSDGNAGLGIYRKNSSGPYTVYFDATLSELSYEGDVNDSDNKSLPKKDESVWCFAWNESENKSQAIGLKKDDSSKKGSVYKAELDEMYPNIMFYSSANENKDLKIDGMKTLPGDSACTYNLTIPWSSLNNPCFYADSSDDSIYNKTKRSGYWDEVGTVRNAEGKTKDGDGAKTGTAIVDIPSGNLTRNSDMLYVNTTLYDYYSDYELNGYNRDNYSDKDLVSEAKNGKLQFIYQPFRQFDQALSTYYSDNNATSPIYWGNFQNYNGNPYSDIEKTLKLYGSDDWSKFIYDNNSMWGRNSTKYTSSNTSPAGELKNIQGVENGHNATQGLVSDTLSDNNLMIETSSGTVKAPYFDESFITGNNSKNTVLGKVYKGVTFPFVKEKMTSKSDSSKAGTVEYWKFDSATSTKNGNLELQHSDADGYFLNPTDTAIYGQTADAGFPKTGGKNYFPFNNNSDQSGKAVKLNYGFGQKFDLKFKLTSDGTVTTDKNEKVPIEFNFSGDDDVWVFIDGKLVLDVGGGHGKVTGTINFKDKKATVSSVKNDDATKGGATQNVEKEFKNVKEITDDYFTKEHTLTMFYMERGLWESNMSISFNFPDENEFAVEKKVDTTGVNTELFPISLFEDASVFPFTIQNQATHYAPKATESSDAKSHKTYNDSFSAEKLSKISSQNTFEFVDSKDGQSKVVHWKARSDDAEGTYVDKRFGIIQPAEGDTFNASDTNAFLQFKMYYDYQDIPGLTSTYLELEDGDGKTIGGYLSGKTYGNSSLVQKKWNTIQVDLSKLQGKNTFDYSKIKKIKFNYNFERDIYLDDFKFIPSVVAATKTGFVTQQQDIPDYGSATSGTLKYPEGAQYTLSKNDGSSKLYRIGSDGKFALADGETATFSDQFRRGSYIAVSEDVNSSVFDTTWTLYENGQAVSTMEKGDTVVNKNPIPSVQNVKSDTIRDGRKEEYKHDLNGNEIFNKGYTTTGYAKNQDGNTENENTIVFRSYAEPDNQTTMTKLKATFVNKVKTGKIEIRKEAAKGSGELNGKYTFRIEFSNVAGLSLEPQKIVREYEINAGASKIIDGIPAGTDYRISEINSSDGSTLESVIVKNNNSFDAGYDPVTKVVAGKVIASSDIGGDGIANKDTSTDATIITFNNTLKPTINLNLTKVWENPKGITLPDSIKIRLQRSRDAGKNWETVKYDGKNETITLSQYYDGKWSYSFENLDQYVDYTAEQRVPYTYRVVEVSGDDGSETEIENGGYLNDKYKVTYSENIDCSDISTENPESKTKSFTITNTYSPKTNIKITKQDASTKKLLGGVEFKLEKMKKNTSTGDLVVDESFNPQPVTTGDSGSTLGIAEFKDLEDGTYRLTETKTVKGYNLLKDPITIKIDRKGQTKVNDEACEVKDNTIYLTIGNRMKFLLPKTGGYGAMLFILCGMALATLCCLIFFLINLRKEVQYSRHKRQRRNAIGK